MIVSTSAIRFLALATLAVSAGATNSIRGNTKQAQDSESSPQNRDLMEINMDIDLDKMDCKEDTSDGSIVCIFRVMPPADNMDNVMYNCLSTSKSNFCLKSEVSQVMFNQVPPDALVPATPPQNPKPEPQPVLVNPTIVGSVGTCPAMQQNTGLGCSQYIPSGATETLCVYGQTRCECKLYNNDPSIAVGWKCYVSQQPVTTLPAPNPPNPPASNNESNSAFQCRPFGSGCSGSHPIASTCLGTPACCPNNIIEDWTTNANICKHGSNSNLSGPPANTIPANINSVTSPSKPSDTNYQQGFVNVSWKNDDDCPASTEKPKHGTACDLDFGIACTYDFGGKVKDCACLSKDTGKWKCVDTRFYGLNSF